MSDESRVNGQEQMVQHMLAFLDEMRSRHMKKLHPQIEHAQNEPYESQAGEYEDTSERCKAKEEQSGTQSKQRLSAGMA